MSNLFIIGNGFDLAHHIKSSYEDFHQFLLHNYGVINQTKFHIPLSFSKKPDCSDIDAANLLLKLITNAEKNKVKWTDFENSLGKLDYSALFKSSASEIYNSSIVKSLKIAIPKIKQFFINWLKKIDIQSISAIDSFRGFINPTSDYFITFNYTTVLEDIYHVQKICHVHGDINHNIILGHGISSEHIYFNLLKNNSLKLEIVPHEMNSYLSYNDILSIYHHVNSTQKNQVNYFQEAILRNLSKKISDRKSVV